MRRFAAWAMAAFFAFLISPARPAFGDKTAPPTRKISFPGKIEYDGKIFIRDASRQEEECYLEADLDGDPDPEIAVAFMASYKEEEEEEDTPQGRPLTLFEKKEEVRPVQHLAFYQIYDIKQDGRYHAVKTLTGMDAPGKIEILKIKEDTAPAVAFLSPGGERYTDIAVYRWEEGGLRLLLNDSSSCGIEIDAGSAPAVIRIGTSPLKNASGCASWKTLRWNETSDKFEPDASS